MPLSRAEYHQGEGSYMNKPTHWSLGLCVPGHFIPWMQFHEARQSRTTAEEENHQGAARAEQLLEFGELEDVPML